MGICHSKKKLKGKVPMHILYNFFYVCLSRFKVFSSMEFGLFIISVFFFEMKGLKGLFVHARFEDKMFADYDMILGDDFDYILMYL